MSKSEKLPFESQMMSTLTKPIVQRTLLLVLPFLIYGSTLGHQYALDDALYITDNQFTKKGFAGIGDLLSHESLVGFYGEQKSLLTGGRYRPLAHITYAIEYQFFGENPGISHAINIILYSLLMLLLYNMLRRFTKAKGGLSLWLFFGLLLFMAHPLHVEVVANIKGRDQVLSLMAMAGIALLSFKFFEGKKWALLPIFGLFFLGLLAKENAITFLPIIPLAFYFFDSKKLKETFPVASVLLVSTVAWFGLRSVVLSGFESVESNTLLNDPFLDAVGTEKMATTFYTWLLYIKLLVFPHPLTHDYYPFQIPLVSLSHVGALLSLVFHAALLFFGIKGLMKRKVYGFWIIFYAATFSISSNLFFNIGTFMNDRFMFEPSLAFCIGVAALFHLIKSAQIKWAGLTAVVLAFGVLSAMRAPVWKDNYTLFTTDAETSNNSVKALTASGGMMLERATSLSKNSAERQELLDNSIKNLRKAVELLPTDVNANTLLGNALLNKKGPDAETAKAYSRVLEIAPENIHVPQNVLITLGDASYPAQTRMDFASHFSGHLQNSHKYHYELGRIYGRELNDLPASIKSLERALELKPDYMKALTDLGTALAMSQQFEKSNEVMLRALKRAPKNKQVLSALMLNYRGLGNEEEAQKYLQLLEAQN